PTPIGGGDPRANRYAPGAAPAAMTGSYDPAAGTARYPRPEGVPEQGGRTGAFRADAPQTPPGFGRTDHPSGAAYRQDVTTPYQPDARRGPAGAPAPARPDQDATRIDAVVGTDSGPHLQVSELVPVQRAPEHWPGTGRPMAGQEAQWSPAPEGAGGEAGGELVPWRDGDAGVRTIDLVKDYGSGPGAVRALAGLTVSAERNRFTAIMGPSGSGKSTLLHCMAGLDAPTSGRVLLGPTDLTQLPEKKLTKLRRERVGFVFQSYALLPQLSVKQNITLPLEVAGRKIDGAWLKTIVEALDLGKVLKQRPTRLSGGQQQRVAMARALLPRPDVVFADEPTGALDASTAREMLQFLRTSVHQLGQTIVMVTHDPLAAEHTDHVLLLHQGALAAQIANPTAPVVLEALTVLDRMPADGWVTGGYRAAATGGGYPGGTGVYPAAPAAAPRLALPAGPSARPA
ncbi:ABC transporter ATP-binding protein, partial [Pseudonocardia lacus]|uniref:ABC transporter ATP-binding protein n=1 Tax=Pseudonocardia lacus TaxID=2835865 RepID=UPI0027E27D68